MASSQISQKRYVLKILVQYDCYSKGRIVQFEMAIVSTVTFYPGFCISSFCDLVIVQTPDTCMIQVQNSLE